MTIIQSIRYILASLPRFADACVVVHDREIAFSRRVGLCFRVDGVQELWVLLAQVESLDYESRYL